MPTRAASLHLLALSLGLLCSTACASEDGNSGGGCREGTFGCPCIDGFACEPGLTCSSGSNVCIAPDGGDAGDGGDGPITDLPSGDGDGDGDGDITCSDSSTCAETDVCFGSVCRPATDLVYDVETSFEPNTCEDGLSYPIDPFYELYIDGVLAGTTDWISVCGPANWGDTFLVAGWEVPFWAFIDDEGNFTDEPLLDFCFNTGGDCTPVPPVHLHAGQYETVQDGHTVSLVFTPISD